MENEEKEMLFFDTIKALQEYLSQCDEDLIVSLVIEEEVRNER